MFQNISKKEEHFVSLHASLGCKTGITLSLYYYFQQQELTAYTSLNIWITEQSVSQNISFQINLYMYMLTSSIPGCLKVSEASRAQWQTALHTDVFVFRVHAALWHLFVFLNLVRRGQWLHVLNLTSVGTLVTFLRFNGGWSHSVFLYWSHNLLVHGLLKLQSVGNSIFQMQASGRGTRHLQWSHPQNEKSLECTTVCSHICEDTLPHTGQYSSLFFATCGVILYN